jgi:hypothetical protein
MSFSSQFSANFPITEAAPVIISGSLFLSKLTSEGTAIRIASCNSAMHRDQRCLDDSWMHLTIFNQLSNRSRSFGSSTSQNETLVAQRLDYSWNSCTDSITGSL